MYTYIDIDTYIYYMCVCLCVKSIDQRGLQSYYYSLSLLILCRLNFDCSPANLYFVSLLQLIYSLGVRNGRSERGES